MNRLKSVPLFVLDLDAKRRSGVPASPEKPEAFGANSRQILLIVRLSRPFGLLLRLFDITSHLFYFFLIHFDSLRFIINDRLLRRFFLDVVGRPGGSTVCASTTFFGYRMVPARRAC